MTTSSLAGMNIAFLVANGFDENQMAQIQRELTKARVTLKTIAPEQGVVNGWQGEGWGHYFPVDALINEALGSDFNMLVLPGGSRGAAKLKSNLHTRRIIGHFLDAGKPIAAIGSGVGLLATSQKIAGRMVSAPDEVEADLTAAGAALSEEPMEIEGNLLTADGSDLDAWVAETLAFFTEATQVKEAA